MNCLTAQTLTAISAANHNTIMLWDNSTTFRLKRQNQGALYGIIKVCRSQWSRGLRRGSASTRLLELRVRIPPKDMDVSLMSDVFCHVEVSATGQSLIQRSPTECVSLRYPKFTKFYTHIYICVTKRAKKAVGMEKPTVKIDTF
jgi:hypothetical protein